MVPHAPQRISVIDSHTGGEPTRVIIGGVEELQGASMAEKRDYFAREYDWLRTAAVREPRGHDAVVGSILCEPVAEDCVAGVIFFNNVGCLQGCLHGTMGVVVTLAHLGRIGRGSHRIDTPTGVVTVTHSAGGHVAVRNIPSYRAQTAVKVTVPGFGDVVGDVAWGGNWFFLTEVPDGLSVHKDNIELLTSFAWAVRRALADQGTTGAGGAEIDHIEIFGPPADPGVTDSKNFVLCPGKAYDRSPCGTGTSAKLACLFAGGELAPGERWRQAGILGSVFEGSVEPDHGNPIEGAVVPTVSGSAFVTAEAELLIDPSTPFPFGIL